MSSHEQTPPRRASLGHRLIRMTGRSRTEDHRAATPLELFFDLTFVIAFSAASSEFAHAVASGHVSSGLVAFAFSMFAATWAWINFTWFASAYDTDDWLFRVTTMVQMVGVLVVAMGIQPVFASIEQGGDIDNEILVLGYVIMRVAMVFQWLRAAKQDPGRRRTCLTYAGFIAVAQVGWVALIPLRLPLLPTLALMAPLYAIELVGPWVAERKGHTPWHPHHIAERYGLLAIIALGECLLGTIASLQSVVELNDGWTVDAALVGLAGTGLAFSMWWLYFIFPAGDVLAAHRHKAFPYGYGHLFIFAAIAATGAGLHVAAYYLEHEAVVGATGVVASVAIPVAAFGASLLALYDYMVGPDPLHLWLGAVSLGILATSVALAAAQVPIAVCLVIVAISPVPAIVADEVLGARHREEALARLGA